jgi:thymidine kinase
MATITVVEGPMRSGKSEEIIAEANKYRIAGKKVLVIKPKIDKRTTGAIASRKWDGGKPVLTSELLAHEIINGEHLRDLIRRYSPEIIVADECQFFDHWFYDMILYASKQLDIPVWLAGLGLDAWQKPFRIMPDLLALADVVIKKTAVCSKCRCLGARFTQKLYGSSEQIEVGDALYEPRCEKCHTMPAA